MHREEWANGAPALALLVKQGPTADAVLWPNLLNIAMYKGWMDHHSNGVLVHAVVDHVRER